MWHSEKCFHCFHGPPFYDFYDCVWGKVSLIRCASQYPVKTELGHDTNIASKRNRIPGDSEITSMQYSNIIFTWFKPLWKKCSHKWSIFALRWNGKELHKYESSSRKYSMWSFERVWGAFRFLLTWTYQQGKGENWFHDLQVHQSIMMQTSGCYFHLSKRHNSRMFQTGGDPVWIYSCITGCHCQSPGL